MTPFTATKVCSKIGLVSCAFSPLCGGSISRPALGKPKPYMYIWAGAMTAKKNVERTCPSCSTLTFEYDMLTPTISEDFQQRRWDQQKKKQKRHKTLLRICSPSRPRIRHCKLWERLCKYARPPAWHGNMAKLEIKWVSSALFLNPS